ncbi:MAG TPA: HisA/HisF-related TIM barrel protein [Actinomycetota bacterium]|nr:HisA/HisF-related TIM barrel protein [Actinomycetota bacterium]
MEVVPALDLAGGRLARLGPGGQVPAEAFGGDPLAAAEAFVAAGARWLHVVDLDLASRGEPANAGLLGELAGLGARVQASGGVTDLRTAEALLEAGAERVVLGSGALADPRAVERAVLGLGDRIVLGLEVEGDQVRPRGRASGVGLPLRAALDRLRAAEVPRVLVTAVARVGGLEGPELDVLRTVAAAVGRPVLAAGGIASLRDLRAVAAVRGVEGAVVGRAALEGRIDLREAIGAFG